MVLSVADFGRRGCDWGEFTSTAHGKPPELWLPLRLQRPRAGVLKITSYSAVHTHCRPPLRESALSILRYLRASPWCVYNRPQSFLDASRYYTVWPLSRHRRYLSLPASGVLSIIRIPSEIQSYTPNSLKSIGGNCDLLRFYYRRIYILTLITKKKDNSTVTKFQKITLIDKVFFKYSIVTTLIKSVRSATSERLAAVTNTPQKTHGAVI